MPKFNIINLSQPFSNCAICWEMAPVGDYFLPMYESEVVDTDKTDDWAGQHVCQECYEKNKHLAPGW